MLHQPLELGIPSVAIARSQRIGGMPILPKSQRPAAAEETTQLIDAIDEAFAALPESAQPKSENEEAAKHQAADLHQQTNSLASLLAMQLQELDQQRGRIAQLLDQIAQPASRGK
jgi:Lon protease-like protein